MGIFKKVDDKSTKIRGSVQYLYMSHDSPIVCDFCYKPLGLIHMMRSSVKVKKGTEYLVVCKRCNKINKRVKGDAGKKIDKRWGD